MVNNVYKTMTDAELANIQRYTMLVLGLVEKEIETRNSKLAKDPYNHYNNFLKEEG